MRAPLIFSWIIFSAVLGILGADAPASSDQLRLQRLGSRNIRLHDPSTIVRHKDHYWLFYTGRGVPSYHSIDLLTWTAGPRIFTNSPAWVTNAVPRNRGGLDFWAPDVIQLDNRYLVYYSVSTFGRNTSAIALAANKTLDPEDPAYNWSDEGIVIQSASTNDYNAIDPAVTLDQGNRLWMSFGSFWNGIKLVELDRATGKNKPGAPLHSLARNPAIEAPFIYHHGTHYYLFVNWGACCRGTNSTYNIRIGRAEKIIGPYLDKAGIDMAEGGGTLFSKPTGPKSDPVTPASSRKPKNSISVSISTMPPNKAEALSPFVRSPGTPKAGRSLANPHDLRIPCARHRKMRKDCATRDLPLPKIAQNGPWNIICLLRQATNGTGFIL